MSTRNRSTGVFLGILGMLGFSGTLVTTLASENGATTEQMMAICGWSDIKHAEQYSKEARRKKLAGDSIHTINLEGAS